MGFVGRSQLKASEAASSVGPMMEQSARIMTWPRLLQAHRDRYCAGT
jgi:hypothetical protein